MKRWFTGIALAAAISLVSLLSACTAGSAKPVDGKTNVVTSFYPLYYFAVQIGGDHAHVVNLVPAGVEPHDWSPKSRDVSLINKSQLFVYQGAGFEAWVPDLLRSMPKDASVRIVEASQGLALIPSSDEEEEKEEHGKEADQGHDHAEGYDPHAWLSPPNAKKMAETIKNAFVAADPANEADYEANFAQLAQRFDELDAKFRKELAQTSKKEIVVSHRAFEYLCREYGLTQKAIMGVSPDAEPTAQDLKRINAFVKDNGVTTIFFEELVSDKLAKTLAKDAKVGTAVLNPLEGLTDEQQKNGEDYFSVMENNLQNLRKALQ